MSDDEDRPCRYGTALPELPNDVIPTKKPITVADQIAVDSNGKRRFHGAFTGGFSAGFWNTVGSLEGWKPQAFKSSRSEKAQRLTQAPTDFMDDEDIGEFGIAPQRIQTTEDFTAAKSSDKESRKRTAAREDGPILGTPVLQLFLKPAKDKASVSLLKKMGWREQQGIGSRQTKSEKKKAAQRYLQERGGAKVYNCDMGPFQKSIQDSDDEDDNESADSDDSGEEITFAPDDYEPFLHAFKTNRFGLGYEGLNRATAPTQSKHVNLFAPFEVLDRKNKKLSITGQAFGVGAFEEDDDDIYAREDMTNYDFSLGEKAKTAHKKQTQTQSSNIITGFASSKSHQKRMNKKIFTIDLPSSFSPRNWAMRKTRFGPAKIPPPAAIDDGHKRHMLTAEERGMLLNEPRKPSSVVETTSENVEQLVIPPAVAAVIVKEEPLDNSSTPQKAPNFIKLPDHLNFDRFVSEKDIVVVKEEKVKVEPKKVEVKRTKSSWLPCSLLYEKMNIAEPMRGLEKRSNKGGANFSLFQCLSETKKNRKKTYRDQTDLTDMFTNAKRPDDDITTSNANIISIPPVANQEIPAKTSEVLKSPISLLPSASSLPTASVTSSVQKPKLKEPPTAKPKTELEIKSLAMETKHPAEKKDLFKAIFDSDEEEEEEKETKPIEKIESSLEQPTPVPKNYLPEPSSILNVLRNTSPPRGIFSNMFARKRVTKDTSDAALTESKNSSEETMNVEKDPLVYGPSLPISKSIPSFARSDSITMNSTVRSNYVADEWVEKVKIEDHSQRQKHKKSDKKSKKHKRDKAKNKKSKSKERSR